jgi:ABC-type multidrug transport system permease subunit
MRPISEVNKPTFLQAWKDSYKKAYTHDWIFSGFIEKFIVFGSVAWTVWSIGLWLWRML